MFFFFHTFFPEKNTVDRDEDEHASRCEQKISSTYAQVQKVNDNIWNVNEMEQHHQ